MPRRARTRPELVKTSLLVCQPGRLLVTTLTATIHLLSGNAFVARLPCRALYRRRLRHPGSLPQHNAHRQSVEKEVAAGLSEDPFARLPDLGIGSQYAIPGQADAASLDLNQNKSQKYKHYEVFGALINAP